MRTPSSGALAVLGTPSLLAALVPEVAETSQRRTGNVSAHPGVLVNTYTRLQRSHQLVLPAQLQEQLTRSSLEAWELLGLLCYNKQEPE